MVESAVWVRKATIETYFTTGTFITPPPSPENSIRLTPNFASLSYSHSHSSSFDKDNFSGVAIDVFEDDENEVVDEYGAKRNDIWIAGTIKSKVLIIFHFSI
jgi:hypothetical protein